MKFDISYHSPDGKRKHSVVEAAHMSEAVEYIEAVKGGNVYRCIKRKNLPQDRKGEISYFTPYEV